MNRRDFSQVLTCIGTAGLPMAFSGHSLAQGAPVEGEQFIKLSQPLPKAANGKIDVVEFFWYGCPHCYAFEPYFDAWAKRQPADVQVRRVPIALTATQEMHARIFYSLEAMGQLEALHRKVFATLQVERKRLDKESDVVPFATALGADSAKFAEMFKSFSVQTKLQQGKQLSAGYRIDGVPTIGVAGRWYTSGQSAGGHTQALQVTDYLIQQARRG